MEASIKGLLALRRLRRDWQDDAGLDFPQVIHTEMLVLYDVCRCLDLNIFQCREVMGEMGLAYVNGFLERRVEINE